MSPTTIAGLTQRVLRHRDERDWKQFHNPKELAISLCVESTELLALMQWKSADELPAVLAKKSRQLSDELADVLHSLLLLAHDVNVDLPAALEQKLKSDAVKYPIDKANGQNRKYDEL